MHDVCASTGLVGHYVETKEDLFKNIQPLVIGYFPIDYKLNVKGHKLGDALVTQISPYLF